MRKTLLYWLLAHFPRPIAVFYAMMIDFGIEWGWTTVLVGWAVSFAISVVILHPVAIATCATLTLGTGIYTIYGQYRIISAELPQREKKQEDE